MHVYKNTPLYICIYVCVVAVFGDINEIYYCVCMYYMYVCIVVCISLYV